MTSDLCHGFIVWPWSTLGTSVWGMCKAKQEPSKLTNIAQGRLVPPAKVLPDLKLFLFLPSQREPTLAPPNTENDLASKLALVAH